MAGNMESNDDDRAWSMTDRNESHSVCRSPLLFLMRSQGVPQRLGLHCCLGGVAVRRRTRDRNVAGSTPDWGAIKSRSIQPSIPPG